MVVVLTLAHTRLTTVTTLLATIISLHTLLHHGVTATIATLLTIPSTTHTLLTIPSTTHTLLTITSAHTLLTITSTTHTLLTITTAACVPICIA